jgi:hypothetical protein
VIKIVRDKTILKVRATPMRSERMTVGTLLVAIAMLSGCSSEPAKDAKKATGAPHKIQGKAVVMQEATAADSTLNAGGPTVYLQDGLRRYRMFFKTQIDVEAGKEYVAEGVFAQKMIEEIGDPDAGKNGYPLEASCKKVVKTAWPMLAFDTMDSQAGVVRSVVKRYPARPLFLVTKLEPAATEGAKKAADEDDQPPVAVPADKQKALLTAGAVVQPAPLWEPKGGTAKCKVVIGKDGKVTELSTGAQLCEAVQWSEFQYKPREGKPARVKTEVEITFEPRK